MAKVSAHNKGKGNAVEKRKGKAVETEPAKKGRKSKTISVNEISKSKISKYKSKSKIRKSKRVQPRKGKGKSVASRAKDKALVVSQSYPRGMTRAEMVEWRGPIKRANSAGLFGSTPSPSPIRIDISNGVIMHNKAKKTLLGIVRAFWPVGAYTWTDINDKYPDWVEKKVIEEFYKFYCHQRGQSRRGSMRTIAGHVKALIKRTVHEEKDRAFAKSKKIKKSVLELKPSYFNDLVWEGMIARWNSEDHMHLAEVGAQNRKKVVTLHSAGARSFQEVEKILTDEKHGVPPTRLEVWDKSHTKVGKEVDENGQRVYTSAAAKRIALKYAKILEENGFDPAQADKAAEPFQWWLMVTEPNCDKPKKNRFIGYPRIPARKLVKDLSVQFDEEVENRVETSAAGAARNSSEIPKKIFADVVGGVIEILKNDPSTYERELNEDEVKNLALAAMDLSNPTNRGDFSKFISNQVLYLVTDLVDDMFKRYQAKAKDVLDDISDEEGDVTDISESDDEGDVAGTTEGAGADAGATDDAEGDVEGEDSDTEGEDGESDGESEAEKGEGSAGEEED